MDMSSPSPTRLADYDPRYDPLVHATPGHGRGYAPTYWVASAGAPPVCWKTTSSSLRQGETQRGGPPANGKHRYVCQTRSRWPLLQLHPRQLQPPPKPRPKPKSSLWPKAGVAPSPGGLLPAVSYATIPRLFYD